MYANPQLSFDIRQPLAAVVIMMEAKKDVSGQCKVLIRTRGWLDGLGQQITGLSHVPGL